MSWDWTTSRAHLLLLDSFGLELDPADEDERDDDGEWRHEHLQLGEDARSAIARLVQSGALEWTTRPSELADRTVAELKAALRRIGARTTGTKAVLMARLRETSPVAVAELCPDRHGYVQTKLGSELVARFRNATAAAEDPLLADVSRALAEGDYATAYRVASAWQVATHGPNPLDSSARLPMERQIADFSQLMRWLTDVRPGILSFLTEDELRWAKWAAAHELLWGRDRVEVPAGMSRGHMRDTATVVRMLVFAVYHLRRTAPDPDLHSSRPGAIWKLLGTDDGWSCPACRRRDDMTGTLEQIGELPHPGCTSERGCRCIVVYERRLNP